MNEKQMNDFIQRVLRDSDLQDTLGKASTHEEFVKSAVTLGEKLGYNFSEEDVTRTIAAAKAEEDAAAASGGVSGESEVPAANCSSSGTISHPAYTMQCGLSTQKCLCTL
jgi:predicted ribosomally synthesized peptide with nif11-like leader